ncbi:MAG: hypothetical protein H7308_06660 [Chthonomonadaceae bacterium]|nr:hypothetical protein [Chthonomonadaceae bacterium]
MMTKAERVRMAIASCGMCFESVGKDMWTKNERIEELWFEVEDKIDNIESAEKTGSDEDVRDYLHNVLALVTRIEQEMIAEPEKC